MPPVLPTESTLAAIESAGEAPPARPVFELCHVGVVLRALLGVQGGVALYIALGANGPLDWWQGFLEACTLSVPAQMSWLLVVCGLKLRLAAWPLLRVRFALLALGALCAFLPWWAVSSWLAWVAELPINAFRGLAVAAAGACAAALLLQWLLLRARAEAPTAMQARWVELQARIRPHFLFNTLNTAVALVRVAPQQAERVLEDLAELFQAALSAPGQDSSLGAEAELARRYLDIEQLRFGERLRLQWDIAADCAAARLPPLLLQPLVENAVRYGVEPNEAGGLVEVSARRLGGEVELLVRNSVAGAAPGGHGLALANVRERLKLMHDVAAQMQVESELDRFSVRIRLPMS